MNDSCPNCGRPTLPSDTVCWHCGYQLPPHAKQRSQAESKKRGRPSRIPANDPASAGVTPADYDFRALAVYGLLTLAVILGLLLVMRSLSQRPILVRSAPLALGGDWVAVTDESLRYTISLPTDWQWLDVGFRDQDELLDALESRQPYIRPALGPLGEAAGDVEILGVAIGSQTLEEAEPLPFVVIGRSERLRQLTPRAALDALSGRSLPISEAVLDTHLAGQSQARFTILDTPNDYQCRHLFVTDGEVAAYLVAACAPQARFVPLSRALYDILNSFQLLER